MQRAELFQKAPLSAFRFQKLLRNIFSKASGGVGEHFACKMKGEDTF